jgi:hypothetical protein
MNFNLKEPTIILGMHRSGTSLLTSIIKNMGVKFGKTVAHEETVFFKKINSDLYEFANCSWDTIDNFKYLLNNDKAKNSVINYTKRKIDSYGFLLNFFRFKIPSLDGSGNKLWGWKDPKNTITFPIYNSIFPRAKYIFIYRNGIDVAESLKVREEKRNIYDPLFSAKCLELEGGFELWKEYNNFFLENKNKINNNLLIICYENLVENPQKEIERISSFLKIKMNSKKNKNIISNIENNKSYKFTKNKKLMNFYNNNKNQELMKYFGYNHPKYKKL